MHLRRERLRIFCVVALVRRQLARREDGEQLVLAHGVTFGDEQATHLAAHLRADDDVVGGDDAGEHERRRRARAEIDDEASHEEDGASSGGQLVSSHGVSSSKAPVGEVRRPGVRIQTSVLNGRLNLKVAVFGGRRS